MEYSTLRPIVDLVPRYAHARRAGWTPLSAGLDHVTLPEYIVLRRAAILINDVPIPSPTLHANLTNPYSLIDTTLDRLPRLVELGLLARSDNAYVLAPAGRKLLMHGERAANDYAAARIHLPPNDLARLASTLHDIVERQRQAPEPTDKAGQDQVPRLRQFDRRQTPPLQLEYALYAMQRARDDAHIAAWRAAGFRGPSLDLLSRIWAGDASTITELVERTRDSMRPADVAELLDELEYAGYVMLQLSAVTITSHGRDVRNAIERETDRVYFAPWPEIDAGWVRGQLEALATTLAPQLPLP